MLVTDIGDEALKVGHQYHILTSYYVRDRLSRQQQLKNVTNIQFLFCHQHSKLSPTSMKPPIH